MASEAPATAPPHLLHVFSTFVPAGPQVRTAKLFSAFGGEFRHSIVAMDGRTEGRELIDPALDVRWLDAPPKAGTLRTVPRMRALLQRERPDLVLTYNFGALDTLLAARLLGLRRVIHHEDGFHPDELESFKRRRVWLRRWILPTTHRVVVISDTLRRIAVEVWNEHPRHLAYIPNGIRIEDFAPRDGNAVLRARLGIPSTSFVIGAVGHLRPEKNLPRLFAAAAIASAEVDVRLLVLGDGPERSALEALAQRPPLAGKVHFVGYQQDPREFYRAMDVFALTSDTEQMPIALLEAMASRVAVVATNVGDVLAMLPGDQASFVVLAGGQGCTQSLAEGIKRLAKDPELRVKLGERNHERAKKFYSEAAMVEAYRELYRAALR
jgi:L-malate glycosyltransferase